MDSMASQITSLAIVYSAVYSGVDKKKTSKLHGTGLFAGNSPGTGEFPAQMASSAENISIWWRHHAVCSNGCHFVWSLYAERNVCIIEICRFLAQHGSLGSHFSEIISVCKMAAILSSPLFSQSKLCTIEICLGNYHKHKLNDRRCCQLFLRWSNFDCRSTCDSLAIQYHPSNMRYMYMQRDIINQCS